MRPFAYTAPATLEDAIALLGASARPLAGGTDLITLMKAELARPDRLVAISGLLPRGIKMEPDGLALGAATTLSEIESDPDVSARFTALAEAAAAAASPQLRNMATIGGNLLQRPRCWYFRNPHLQCWLKGGANCPARDGENRNHALFGGAPCVAVHPSDLASVLLAFEATLRLHGAAGERTVRLDEFFALPEEARRTETRLGQDELLLGIRLPLPRDGTRSIYLKAMDRAAFSFALAGVAVVLRLSQESGRIEYARIVLSGVAPIPWRACAAEKRLQNAEPTESVMRDAAEAALTGATPLAHNGWKAPLVRALLAQALSALV
jgi:xanthine dehydrogenase YagS FAD-binding subunit